MKTYKHMPGPMQIVKRRQDIDSPCQITGREHQILDGFCRGLVRKELGRELGIAPTTIDVILQPMKRRVGARSTFELIAMAIRSGWVQ